ncbi:MAG: enoyl-CoA hydratase/isomerase family protein [Candidatus Lokiarchaeota archaeon]|nr:enoyl-CoA hydratase/isomerase family protein [Candidatus Lokiarchaeota archaeon]
MDFETIKFELEENGIGFLTFNRPKKANAMSFQMVEDLHSLLDTLMTNLDCRVLIMKAEGKVFNAGQDLNDGTALKSKRKPDHLKKYYYLDIPEVVKSFIYYQWRIADLIVKMRKISQPIIAVVQGAAMGAGFSIAMAADIRIAGKNAKFNAGYINIGLTGADMGSSYFLPRLIGLSRASELLYTGRFLNAEEALKTGFVLKVVEEENLLDSAMDLAREMLSKSPLGLRMTKQALNLSLNSPSLETMIQLENRGQVLSGSSKDVLEAFNAYKEKRDPKFPLR